MTTNFIRRIAGSGCCTAAFRVTSLLLVSALLDRSVMATRGSVWVLIKDSFFVNNSATGTNAIALLGHPLGSDITPGNSVHTVNISSCIVREPAIQISTYECGLVGATRCSAPRTQGHISKAFFMMEPSLRQVPHGAVIAIHDIDFSATVIPSRAENTDQLPPNAAVRSLPAQFSFGMAAFGNPVKWASLGLHAEVFNIRYSASVLPQINGTTRQSASVVLTPVFMPMVRLVGRVLFGGSTAVFIHVHNCTLYACGHGPCMDYRVPVIASTLDRRMAGSMIATDPEVMDGNTAASGKMVGVETLQRNVHVCSECNADAVACPGQLMAELSSGFGLDLGATAAVVTEDITLGPRILYRPWFIATAGPQTDDVSRDCTRALGTGMTLDIRGIKHIALSAEAALKRYHTVYTPVVVHPPGLPDAVEHVVIHARRSVPRQTAARLEVQSHWLLRPVMMYELPSASEATFDASAIEDQTYFVSEFNHATASVPEIFVEGGARIGGEYSCRMRTQVNISEIDLQPAQSLPWVWLTQLINRSPFMDLSLSDGQDRPVMVRVNQPVLAFSMTQQLLGELTVRVRDIAFGARQLAASVHYQSTFATSIRWWRGIQVLQLLDDQTSAGTSVHADLRHIVLTTASINHEADVPVAISMSLVQGILTVHGHIHVDNSSIHSNGNRPVVDVQAFELLQGPYTIMRRIATLAFWQEQPLFADISGNAVFSSRPLDSKSCLTTSARDGPTDSWTSRLCWLWIPLVSVVLQESRLSAAADPLAALPMQFSDPVLIRVSFLTPSLIDQFEHRIWAALHGMVLIGRSDVACIAMRGIDMNVQHSSLGNCGTSSMYPSAIGMSAVGVQIAHSAVAVCGSGADFHGNYACVFLGELVEQALVDNSSMVSCGSAGCISADHSLRDAAFRGFDVDNSEATLAPSVASPMIRLSAVNLSIHDSVFRGSGTGTLLKLSVQPNAGSALSSGRMILNRVSLIGGDAGEGHGGCISILAAQSSVTMVGILAADCWSRGSGGAVYVLLRDSHLQLDSSQFTQSYAAGSGGGAAVVVQGRLATVNITSSLVWNTTSVNGHGGGVAIWSDSRDMQSVDLVLSDTVIAGCASPTASGMGGGLAVWGTARLRLIRCVLSQNTAGFMGGGLYFQTTTTSMMELALSQVFMHRNLAQTASAIHAVRALLTAADTVWTDNICTIGLQSIATDGSAACLIGLQAAAVASARWIPTTPPWYQPGRLSAGPSSNLAAAGAARFTMDVGESLVLNMTRCAVAATTHIPGFASSLQAATEPMVLIVVSTNSVQAAVILADALYASSPQSSGMDLLRTANSHPRSLRVWVRDTVVDGMRSALVCVDCTSVDIRTSLIASCGPALELTNHRALYIAELVAERSTCGGSLPILHLQVSLGPTIVTRSWLNGRGVGGIAAVDLADSTAVTWQATPGPIVLVLSEVYVAHGRAQPGIGRSQHFRASGGGITVALRRGKTQQPGSGQSVWLQRSMITQCWAPAGNGGGLAVQVEYAAGQAKPFDEDKLPLRPESLVLYDTSIRGNNASQKVGRGSNVYVHSDVALDIRHSLPTDYSKRVNTCPVGVEEQAQLLEVRSVHHSPAQTCSAYIDASSGQPPGVFVDGECAYGWVARTSSALSASSAGSAGQITCTSCPQGTVYVTDAGSDLASYVGRCMPCPENAFCGGSGHVMVRQGYWMLGVSRSRSLVLSGTKQMQYPAVLQCHRPVACVGYHVTDIATKETDSLVLGTELSGIVMPLFRLVSAGPTSTPFQKCLARNWTSMGPGSTATSPALIVPPGTWMLDVWDKLQRCLRQSPPQTSLRLLRHDLSTTVLMQPDLPTSFGRSITPPQYTAFHVGAVSAEEYGRGGGELGRWLLPSGCAVGYTGPMCYGCSAGYAKAGSECKPCASQSLVLLQQLLLTMISVTIAIVMTVRRVKSGDGGSTVRDRITQIVLHHVQVLGTMSYIDPPCERVISSVLVWISSIFSGSSTVADFGCLFQDSSSEPTLSSGDSANKGVVSEIYATGVVYVTPLIMIIVWTLLLLLLECFQRRQRRREQEAGIVDLDTPQATPRWFLPGCIVLLTLVYPGILKAMLTLLTCTTLASLGRFAESNPQLFGDSIDFEIRSRTLTAMRGSFLDDSSMLVDMTRRCWTGQHLTWTLTWVLPVGMGYLVLTAWTLYHGLRQYQHAQANTRRRSFATSKQATRWAATRGLYSVYAPHREAWTLIHMVLLVVQVAGVMLMRASASAAAGWAILWLLFRLCAAAWAHPYGQGTAHLLHLGSSATLVISGASFVLMSAGSNEADLNTGRSVSCETRALTGVGVLVTAQAVFALQCVWIWRRSKRPRAASL